MILFYCIAGFILLWAMGIAAMLFVAWLVDKAVQFRKNFAGDFLQAIFFLGWITGSGVIAAIITDKMYLRLTSGN